MQSISNQTHRCILPRKTKQYNPSIVNGYYYNSKIPNEYILEYAKAISTHKHHYQWIADDFHIIVPHPPYTSSDFLRFMKEKIGITCNVHRFYIPNPNTKISGIWEWADREKTTINIYVNGNEPLERQNISIIHESIHALQDFDLEFQNIIQQYSEEIRLEILERITELIAIEIVIPKNFLQNILQWSSPTVEQICNFFQVSRKMASIALKA